MFVIICLFIIIICITLLTRFIKNPAGSLLNPLFLLVLYSNIYLLIPLLYIDYAAEVNGLTFHTSTRLNAGYWSLWYVSVFYLFYLKSIDIRCEFNRATPGLITYRTSLCLYWFFNLTILLIVILYVPSIYAIKGSRGEALTLYEEVVNSRFKLRILMYCHLCSIFILYWKHKKLIYLLPCLLYLLIDYSHGGRTVTLMIFTFCYFLVILKTHKTYLLLAICSICIMILLGVMQRSTSDEFLWGLYMAGAEFSNTFLTTMYLIEHNDYMLDGKLYLLVSFSKIFPGGIVDKMLGFGEWYGNDLSNQIGLGYGLAGNLVTEGLVYGGKFFAFFHPLLIGLSCYILNRMKGCKNLFFVLFVLLICISMQNVVRSYFWGFLLYPIQILVFFLFYLKNDYSKQIFK